MNCEDYQKSFSALLDNELSETECSGLFTHMGTCQECREFFRISMKIQSELNEWRIPEPARLSHNKFIQHERSTNVRDVLPVVRWFQETRISASLATAAIILAMAGTFVCGSLWGSRSKTSAPHKEQFVYSYLLSPVEVQPPPREVKVNVQ